MEEFIHTKHVDCFNATIQTQKICLLSSCTHIYVCVESNNVRMLRLSSFTFCWSNTWFVCDVSPLSCTSWMLLSVNNWYACGYVDVNQIYPMLNILILIIPDDLSLLLFHRFLYRYVANIQATPCPLSTLLVYKQHINELVNCVVLYIALISI